MILNEIMNHKNSCFDMRIVSFMFNGIKHSFCVEQKSRQKSAQFRNFKVSQTLRIWQLNIL